MDDAPQLGGAGTDDTNALRRYRPDSQTWDEVVRAAAHTGQYNATALLMQCTHEHTHDPELLARTSRVRSGLRGLTLLMHAVERRDVARAAEIVGACPTPASRAQLLACVDSHGRTALHLACGPLRADQDVEAELEGDERDALALVELLLGAGADPLAISAPLYSQRCQPIHIAAKWSVLIVQRLVAAGVPIIGELDDSVEGRRDGNSTLLAAAHAPTTTGLRMIPALVSLGARELARENAHNDGSVHAFVSGASFMRARAPWSTDEARVALVALASAGCSLTAQQEGDGQTPMETAAQRGNLPFVEALLAVGVAATTLSLALGMSRPGIVRVLLAAGVSPCGLVQWIGGGSNRTALMFAAAMTGPLESVHLLLGASVGNGVNRRDQDGKTALMHAMETESFESAAVLGVVGALLDAGADVTDRDKCGNTPLHVLAYRGYYKPWAANAARLLLDSGADVTATNNAGKTPAQCMDTGVASDGGLRALLLEAVGGG
jgi:ankyrin repeat protein